MPTNGVSVAIEEDISVFKEICSNTATGAFSIAVGTTANGYYTLYNNRGDNNTAIGYQAGPASGSTGLNNTTAIDNGATVTADNSIVLDNSSVTTIGVMLLMSN